MKLYTVHCANCNVLEKKLTAAGAKFDVVDNVDEVVDFGVSHNIKSAPILELDDGTVLDFKGAIAHLREVGAMGCATCKLGD